MGRRTRPSDGRDHVDHARAAGTVARLNELLGPFGLTFPRYEALMLLSFTRTGALPLGKVGERLQVHRTSVTHIIDKLEKDEFVRRVPHEADRRTTLAEITDSGRDVARRATALLNDDAFGLAALDDGEQEQLTELLRTLRVEAGDFTDVAFRADIQPSWPTRRQHWST